ncbi:uncharacterized protein PG998_005114 [Apiospora kogelbergensis]|uniref:Uncharacterized protein n=1 Tax=Apiospora kogelbergensis TaxID=1337665 RepID=A0AAW0QAS8_9PEZI
MYGPPDTIHKGLFNPFPCKRGKQNKTGLPIDISTALHPFLTRYISYDSSSFQQRPQAAPDATPLKARLSPRRRQTDAHAQEEPGSVRTTMSAISIREAVSFHVEWEERYQQAWIDQVQPNTWVFNWFIIGLFGMWAFLWMCFMAFWMSRR